MESDSKRAILAIVLSGIVLFGWQYLFPTPTYAPEAQQKVESTVVKATKDSVAKNSTELKTESVSNIEIEKTKKEETVTLRKNEFFFTLNNYLTVVETKATNSKYFYPNVFEDSVSTLLLEVDGKLQKAFFNFTKQAEDKYQIQTPDGLFSGLIELSDKGELLVKINSKIPFSYGVNIRTKKIEIDSFYNYNQFFIYANELEKFAVGDDDEFSGEKIKWFGLDFDYHFLATIFPVKSFYNIKMKNEAQGDVEFGHLKATLASEKTNELSYKNIFVQKNYDDLISLGDNLKLSVDFGIWEIIAVPILRGLQFFFNVFPNWGVAIILLTIFIRMLTFPLQYKSFKSMKKMQVIQPEMQKIREKYKDNPQKMQQETMALFKKAGANPLGGCLPLLLQMPVFFAFYKVLYSSVELVDAPFIFWIQDLSKMDPYYVLPVLMSIAMFLNMKLTPTASADPAQQKIMMFMPLIFGFMMMSLPAGLTLYILVSTVMGMLQQLFVYKRVS